MKRREPFRVFELQVAADDGRTVWLSLSGEPVFDADGAFRGYLGAGRDITSQKRAQQLLLLENAVMSCLAGAGGIPFALKGALRAICEGEGWDCAELWKVDATGGALRLHQHWSTPDIQRVAALPEAVGEGSAPHPRLPRPRRPQRRGRRPGSAAPPDRPAPLGERPGNRGRMGRAPRAARRPPAFLRRAHVAPDAEGGRAL